MQVKGFKIHQFGFWKAYWITLRPYLTFVSGTAGLVGLAFIPHPQPLPTVLAFLILFFSYGLGQALTDCFQTDTDSISAPYRPMVQGIVSRQQVLMVSLSGLLIGMLILTYFNPLILIPALLTVSGLLTYTKFKRTWWGGPPWNAGIVALLPIIARMTDRDFEVMWFWRGGGPEGRIFWLVVAVVFFGYVNFVVMGYFKDISADRATGYRTFPVVFGWSAAAIYSDIVASLSAFLTLQVLSNLPGLPHLAGLIFFVAVGVNLWAQIRIHLIRQEQQSHEPIVNVVRAFILYGLSIIVALKPGWLVGLLLYYGMFEYALQHRPEKTQV